MQATMSDIQRFQLEKSIWAAARDFGTHVQMPLENTHADVSS